MTDILEKVDQVADAMRAGQPNNPDVPWAEFSRELPFFADEWRNLARIAIEALREPTEAMLDGWRHHAPELLAPSDIYRAMIDAALGKPR